ncbi:MAG: hypothetical protein CMC67_07705 [Flavobacteriaceae bacterium]|nr:hypothetical protein [Flavobacteriaceae bacterium]
MFEGSNKYFQFVSGFAAFGFTFLQAIDWFFEKYEIDVFYFNLVLIFLVFGFILSVFYFFYSKKKKEKKDTSENEKRSFFFRVGNVVVTSALLFLFIYFFRKSNTRKDLIENTLPNIIKAYESGDNLYVFNKTKSLLDEFPENELLNFYLKKVSYKINVETDLDSVSVEIKIANDSSWTNKGFLPVDSILVPVLKTNDYQIKLVYKTHEYIPNPQESGFISTKGIENTPKEHTFRPGKKNKEIWFPGIYLGDKNSWRGYSISKTEVSNSEYKKFIDDNGYKKPRYWDFPIEIGGTVYEYENTIKLFKDKYDQFGPASWSYGKFPENQENFPVTGISWFEARAFAKYKGMKLPNIFQWLDSAQLAGFELFTLPNTENSNLNSNFLREVNDKRGVNSYKIKNISGNVKEWTTNPHGNNRYAILGGAYFDKSYSFSSFYSLSPFDRSQGNGIRLVSSEKNDLLDKKIIEYEKRDILNENDVSNEVFEVYKDQFNYPYTRPKAKVEKISGYDDNYNIEKFELKTVYNNNEPLHGYIVYSKKTEGLIKPIIIFPTAGGIFNNSDSEMLKGEIIDKKYLLEEGYGLVMPIYYSTFSRKKTINTWWANESDEYKETMIKIGKDFKRSIDYIETRNDIDIKNLSYLGYSWGSITSNILLAIEKRVKTAFLAAGGIQLPKSKKEIAPSIFVRRINIPIMHIYGKSDGFFRYEDSFLPWKKLIGTNPKDLFIIELDGVGHGIPKDTIIKSHLSFLKKYH